MVLSALLSPAVLVAACSVVGGGLATAADQPCYTDGIRGELVVNFLGGGTQIHGTTGMGGLHMVDVVWPAGYTAGWVGLQLEVRSPDGRVIATTGQTVSLPGGMIAPGVFYTCPA